MERITHVKDLSALWPFLNGGARAEAPDPLFPRLVYVYVTGGILTEFYTEPLNDARTAALFRGRGFHPPARQAEGLWAMPNHVKQALFSGELDNAAWEAGWSRLEWIDSTFPVRGLGRDGIEYQISTAEPHIVAIR